MLLNKDVSVKCSMFENIERPLLNPDGFASQVDRSAGVDLPQSLDEHSHNGDTPTRQEITIDAAFHDRHSWLRSTAASVEGWSKDLPISLFPVTELEHAAERKERSGIDRLLEIVTSERYRMSYILRLFPTEEPSIFSRLDRKYVDLHLHSTGEESYREQSETAIQIFCRTASGRLISPIDQAHGPLANFGRKTLTPAEVGLPNSASAGELRSHTVLLKLFIPQFYLEGFARGFAVATSSITEAQRVSNDLLFDSPLRHLKHPRNRELPLFESALEQALLPRLLETDSNYRVDETAKLHWKLGATGSFGKSHTIAEVSGMFVNGDSPMRVAVLDKRGASPLFYRHFNHPLPLATFVEGLNHGAHIGDALAHPIQHWWGKR